METITLDNDITVFYVTSTSYPAGIMHAHERLHALVPFSSGRKYFGISRPEKGAIVYRAAAEEQEEGEAERYGCDILVLRKGAYCSMTVHGFREDPRVIEQAFQQLLNTPGLDPQGYCVEWYTNEEESVHCMIRLEEKPF